MHFSRVKEGYFVLRRSSNISFLILCWALCEHWEYWQWQSRCDCLQWTPCHLPSMKVATIRCLPNTQLTIVRGRQILWGRNEPNIGLWNNLFICCAPDRPGWSLHYLQVSEITMKSQMIVFWQKWADCRLKSSSTLILRNILPIEFPLENLSCARDVWRRRRGIRSSGGGMVKVIRSQESPYLLLTVSLAPWQSSPPATHHSTQPHSAPSSLKLKIFS